ncbi:MAG: CDP-glucose 4,6-dehydratase [Rhodospirillales bacterium]|nr:CDP-glucose 4,6-dehydratase [Rhodospirillales bacterium]
MSPGFWRGRRVLLTGHTGFKGAWLLLWLERMGAEITGLALAPPTMPSLFALAAPWAGLRHIEGDIREPAIVERAMAESDPEIILHLAAQALVRPGYRDPRGTYDSNVMGTLNVLDAARRARNLRAVLVVTTDKVYENPETGEPFREDMPLGGHDPYSSSKACAEILTASYARSFFKSGAAVATARAGNVIGGGDWAEDRLIPDLIRALDAGRPVVLRHPSAVRPWQHVLEPLAGYLSLAEQLVQAPGTAPGAVNFGPDPKSFLTVAEVVERLGGHFDGRPGWQRDPGEHPPEAGLLTLSSSLAERRLGWRSRLDGERALAWTASWYKQRRAGASARTLTLQQIEEYEGLPS